MKKAKLIKESRQGSYMAEAAIVLPIIILAVISIVLILMFFYEQSVEQSKMHMALRAEAGIYSEKMDCATVDWDGTISKGRQGFYPVAQASKDIFMDHQGLLKTPASGRIEGSWRITDGPAHVRRWK